MGFVPKGMIDTGLSQPFTKNIIVAISKLLNYSKTFTVNHDSIIGMWNHRSSIVSGFYHQH